MSSILLTSSARKLIIQFTRISTIHVILQETLTHAHTGKSIYNEHRPLVANQRNHTPAHRMSQTTPTKDNALYIGCRNFTSTKLGNLQPVLKCQVAKKLYKDLPRKNIVKLRLLQLGGVTTSYADSDLISNHL